MARVTTVITSINSDTSEAVTIDAAYTGTDGTITLSASVPATVKVGDVINDSAGNDYLITGISGSDLTCQDFDTTTDPATGAATIGEAYATITLWEADLDAGTNAEVYKSGDDAVGEMYNNGAFDESVTIDGGVSVGLNSILLTVPESERHDGTEGSGVRLVATAARVVELSATTIAKTLEWLEYDGGAQNPAAGIRGDSGPSAQVTVNRVLLHNFTGSSVQAGITSFNELFQILNTIVYDLISENTGSNPIAGIAAVSTSRASQALNCTVHNIVNNNGSGAAYNFGFNDDVDNTIRNNIGTDPSGTSSGAKQCYQQSAPSNAVTSNNLSSDTSASGTGSLISKTSLNQFVSNAPGTEDLHLKAGADAFEAPAADLGTTPTGVNIDIDGFDRNAGATTWSMGAHDGDNLRGVGAIIKHPGMAGGMQTMSGGMRG